MTSVLFGVRPHGDDRKQLPSSLRRPPVRSRPSSISRLIAGPVLVLILLAISWSVRGFVPKNAMMLPSPSDNVRCMSGGCTHRPHHPVNALSAFLTTAGTTPFSGGNGGGKTTMSPRRSMALNVMNNRRSRGRSSTANLSSSGISAETRRMNQLRRELLNRRDGEHFELDRSRGGVKFGSTANLVTEFPPRPGSSDDQQRSAIHRWLSQSKRVAMSIWDPKLTIELPGKDRYRLELMTLKFVTIQLAPRVDVKMWTEKETYNPPQRQRRRLTGSASPINGDATESNIEANTNGEEEDAVVPTTRPVFLIQSVGFDPNLQLLPGIGLSASSLQIQIDVVGELRPTDDGRGVVGKIAFQSSGVLPGPMRLLPSSALSGATDLINRQIVNFAVQSFRRGAVEQYRSFLRAEEQQREVLERRRRQQQQLEVKEAAAEAPEQQ